MVRQARKEDLIGILNLYTYLLPDEDYTHTEQFLPKWEEIMQRDGLVYFVAFEGREIAATGSIIVTPNLTRAQRPYAIIENVVTHPDMRRKGFGRMIVQMAIDHARKQNCYKVMLLSASHRKGAHEFYKKIGFDGDLKRGFHFAIP